MYKVIGPNIIVAVIVVNTVPKSISQSFLNQWVSKERWNIDYVV